MAILLTLYPSLIFQTKEVLEKNVTFATTNRFTSNIYFLGYLGAPKAFKRFQRKL